MEGVYIVLGGDENISMSGVCGVFTSYAGAVERLSEIAEEFGLNVETNEFNGYDCVDMLSNKFNIVYHAVD